LCSPIANSYSTVDSGTFTSNQPTPWNVLLSKVKICCVVSLL
jgi:hypothetical protein